MKRMPIGIQDLQELINGGLFYVDKTQVIFELLNTGNKYYFLSRPRRFGKSLTLSTIKYLYLGKKELFKNTWIFDHWDFDETFPVLYMSFAGYTVDQDIKEYINNNCKIFIEEQVFKIGDFTDRYNISILLEKIFEKTSKQTVIIVDEYDKGVLVNLTNVERAEEMRNFFTSFYAGVKDSDDKIKLFMLTGLTKVLKMSVFSVLNNIQDLSFLKQGYKLMGYTQAELESNFETELHETALCMKISYEKLLDMVKIRYNGYNFGNPDDTIYNPWNINNFIANQQLSYYWADTGIPSAILYYIEKNQIKVDDFITRLNAGDLKIKETDFKLENLHQIKSEVLFTNAGYLTIKDYDIENALYTLGYPNAETENVMNDFFVKLTRPNYNFSELEHIANLIYDGIIKKDNDALKQGLNQMIYEFYEGIAYEWTKKNPEGWFKTALGMFLRLNTIYFYPELQNIKGRKDLVIPVNDAYYIIEAKVSKSTRSAIKQIDDFYVPQFQHGKPLIKVGINWNIAKNRVECVIKE